MRKSCQATPSVWEIQEFLEECPRSICKYCWCASTRPTLEDLFHAHVLTCENLGFHLGKYDIVILWFMSPCRLVGGYQVIGALIYTKYGRSIFLQNDNHLPGCVGY
jgi:hypothetical protein